jgi:non-canonical purine NTP pyrophosphatase (RdgB/HAM1 family)
MKLIFATSNQNKIEEVKRVLNSDIVVEGTSLEIEEIQSLDALKVVKQKAIDYYKQLKTPLLVEDTSLSFNGLNGLPGPYINDFSKALGNKGLIDLLSNNDNRRAIAQVTFCLILDENTTHFFEGKVEGNIATEEKGTNGFGWDPIFIPLGQEKTFAEMQDTEKDQYSMRAKALSLLQQFLSANSKLI